MTINKTPPPSCLPLDDETRDAFAAIVDRLGLPAVSEGAGISVTATTRALAKLRVNRPTRTMIDLYLATPRCPAKDGSQ
jgi:hypothetical protein